MLLNRDATHYTQADLSWNASTTLTIDLTTTGQQFTSDAMPFHFYPDDVRVAHRLLPGSGPVDGGSALRLPLVGLNASAAATVRADGRAACAFNGSAVAASIDADGLALHCGTPPTHLLGEVELRVSLNGQQLLSLPADDTASPSLAHRDDSPAHFFVYIEPELVQLTPAGGLLAVPEGNAQVQLILSPPAPLAAGSNVSCRFGEATAPGALLPPALHATAAGVLYPPRRLVAAAVEGAFGVSSAVWQARLAANGIAPEHIFAVQYDANPIDDTMAQWYFDGKGTCVGHGLPSVAACDDTQLVCTGQSPGSPAFGDIFGNVDQQILAVVTAMSAGGVVHPSCPVTPARLDPAR